ncbi:hypothetical protein GGP53_000755 [Salinibacter ruber]|uniref:hypothetical protein n=1 Tax=Salinibacter ruber TaxID=146919 RepID=UPI0021697683|nr:hypothetical protein [Salinibacter ruber]MCS3626926.1 hypothetical protein [Salinibacter ruber]MCS4143822.1 hypothetical protein [Salinibacter ruber]
MTSQKRVLVTGAMRSGTTFVGNVLSHPQPLFYLHEPFNPTWGIEGADEWLAYVRDEDSEYARRVDRFFDVDFTYKSPIGEGSLKGAIKKVVGGEHYWRGLFYRYVAQHYSGMLVKDPLSVLMSRYMHERYGVAVVALVRHPAAFYYSHKRLGWDFDLSNLREQPHLLNDHLEQEAHLLEQTDWTYPERLAILWRCVNKVLKDFSDTFAEEDTWTLKRHEDICSRPIQEFGDVFRRLSLDFSLSVKQYIRESTSRRNPTSAQNKETHQLQRNSEEVAYYWKQEITPEERDQIRSITEPVSSHFYMGESWNIEC